jgi:hypothetical protein
MSQSANRLADKIEKLNPEQVAAVEAFIELLRVYSQDRALTQSTATLSEPAFEAIWNNPEDDAYDAV